MHEGTVIPEAATIGFPEPRRRKTKLRFSTTATFPANHQDTIKTKVFDEGKVSDPDASNPSFLRRILFTKA